jgi:hypothetical protein
VYVFFVVLAPWNFSHEPVIQDEETEPHASWNQKEVESTVKTLSSGARRNGQASQSVS